MNICLTCNEEIPENKRFCNESCLRIYFKDRLKINSRNKVVSNHCKNCFKVIPKGLNFCSKRCLEKLRYKKYNFSLFGVNLKTQGLHYIEIDNPFTNYANVKGEERKELEKIIEDNYQLSKEYIEFIKNLRKNNPHILKVSFEAWLENREGKEIKEIIQELKKIEKPKRKKRFKCLNCGKETINYRIYCNSKCYVEYHSKKKIEVIPS